MAEALEGLKDRAKAIVLHVGGNWNNGAGAG